MDNEFKTDEEFKNYLYSQFDFFKNELKNLNPSLRFFLEKHFKKVENYKNFIDDIFKTEESKKAYLKIIDALKEALEEDGISKQ
jgi:hypothetical protein